MCFSHVPPEPYLISTIWYLNAHRMILEAMACSLSMRPEKQAMGPLSRIVALQLVKFEWQPETENSVLL